MYIHLKTKHGCDDLKKERKKLCKLWSIDRKAFPNMITLCAKYIHTTTYKIHRTTFVRNIIHNKYMPVTKKPWCAQKILPLNVNKSVSSYKKSSTYNISGVEYFESKLCFKSTKRVQNSFHSVIMLNHQYLWILKKQTCYFDIRYPRNWITFGFQSCWNAKSFGIKRYVFISSLAHTQSYSCLKCVLVEKKCASKTHSKFIKCSHQTIRIFNFHKACTNEETGQYLACAIFFAHFFLPVHIWDNCDVTLMGNGWTKMSSTESSGQLLKASK